MKRLATRLVLIGVVLAVVRAGQCVRERREASEAAVAPASDGTRFSREQRDIDRELTPPAGSPGERDGLGAAILVDTSGSMERSAGGGSGSKIEIARRASLDLVDQFARYAADHPGEPVELGLYEFSSRNHQPDSREVIPMGPPDRARAADAVARMTADGGTPIGSAMIMAKRMLDTTGLSRRHLLVVTDGENTDGHEPEDVAFVIAHRPEKERPSIYFVAFDVEASRFTAVRDAGGLVLSAANGPELTQTIDSLLRGKILIER